MPGKVANSQWRTVIYLWWQDCCWWSDDDDGGGGGGGDEQCEGWISEAGLFLQGISREAPHCTTIDDVDRLIKKIENYRIDGYKDQDARLNGMDRIVTDLYGLYT